MKNVKDIIARTVSSSSALKIPVLPESEAAPIKGRIIYDSNTDQLEYANGSIWSPIVIDSSEVGGVLSANLPNPGLAIEAITSTDFVNETITNTQLADTGVISGSYGDSTHVGTFTVNAQGQITSASSVFIIGGTATQIDTGTGLTGGPINVTGTISLADTAVTPGTYGSNIQVPVATVNQQGQITSIITAPIASEPSLISEYYVIDDVGVLPLYNIIFNGVSIQQTGTITAQGVFTASVAGNYSIAFSGVNLDGQGRFQLLQNGGYGIGTAIGLCGYGYTHDTLHLMTGITGTASFLINIPLLPGYTIQVANVDDTTSIVKGNANGPATVLTIIKLS